MIVVPCIIIFIISLDHSLRGTVFERQVSSGAWPHVPSAEIGVKRLVMQRARVDLPVQAVRRAHRPPPLMGLTA